MSSKRKTLKTLADFFSNIPKWMKDKAKPLDPIEPLTPEPLTPVKPRPDIDPPRPVEYDK
jgi:hypothetical protein